MTESNTYYASCSCGLVKIIASGKPVRVSVCHCHACQQRTGSAFGVQARFALEDVTITGNTTLYQREADSGNSVTFHFCPTCGNTMYYFLHGMKDFIAIPVGAFADADFPAPTISIYEERQHAWVMLQGDLEHID